MTEAMKKYEILGDIEFEEEEEESDELIQDPNSIDLEIDQGDDPESEEEQTGDSKQPEPEDDDDDDEELQITIGKEKPEPEDAERQTAPKWVKDLRKEHRETVRRNRQLEEEIQKLKNPQIQQTDIGAKPTLESCEFDPDVFEQKLLEWNGKKQSAERQKQAAEEEQRALQESYKQRLSKYETGKASLKVKDFDEAEDVVKDTLSVIQQGIIIQAAENPELVVLALGRNPKKAKEIAAIKDPIQCTAALIRLEAQLKVTTKKKSQVPPPEKTLKGSGSLSASTDRTLERLRSEAEKSGDYSKVMEYKRSKKQK